MQRCKYLELFSPKSKIWFKHLVFIQVLFCANFILADNPDSLKKILRQTNKNNEKVKLLLNIAHNYLYNNNDSAELYSKTGLELAKSNQQAKESAEFLNYLGVIQTERGNYNNALKFYFESEKFSEKISDTSGLISIFGNIGYIYELQGLNEKALKQYEAALNLCNHPKFNSNKAEMFTHMGSVCYTNGNKLKALNYFQNALKLFKTVKDDFRAAEALNNVGVVFQDLGRYEEALTNFNENLLYAKKMKDPHSLVIAYFNIANLYQVQKKQDFALIFLDSSKIIAEKTKNFEDLIEIYSSYAQIYREKKEFERALDYQVLMSASRDTMLLRNRDKLMIEMSAKYETEKKEKENKILRIEGEKHKAIAIGASIVLILLAMVTFFIYNSYRIKKRSNQLLQIQNVSISEQKEIIEKKHKEITDSINYAERIQKSFLSTKTHLDGNLSEYFIVFKPKDVVSGDFYWSANLKNGNFVLCTADSTGHGVPGAIMSLLNIMSLERAIENHHQPAEILNVTRQIIIDRLKKDGSLDGGKDGMDASLCVYDFKNLKLFVSAAQNPIWIVRNISVEQGPQIIGNNENTKELIVIEIKPDKMPVGKHDRQQEGFTQHEVKLEKGDMIYTLTDGFSDQFGGPEGKKFMSKNLRELIKQNSHLPIAEQNKLLEDTFMSWKGNLEQVDDVTIIGIRI
jgi:serine phosphatase RsbU (regulator of sigma subunit)